MDQPPSRRRLIGEAAAALEWSRGQLAWRAIARDHAAGPAGEGRPVLVLPGFLAGDWTTATLRRTLAAAGYRPGGWGLGTNYGVSQALLDAMLARLAAMTADRPATVIGWSLGGLYAREIAKHAPARVDRVVTLGTPFSGDIRANHAWRLYERVAGHPVDRLPIPAVLAQKPPVPTFALWSPLDGIVAPASARGQVGEADRAIRVGCRHVGFTSAPEALRTILEVLALPV